MNTLGKRIKHIRKEILNINQDTFAEKLGFSRIATVSDYEKNKRTPDLDTTKKIADMADVSIDWLLKGEDTLKTATVAKVSVIPNENILISSDLRIETSEEVITIPLTDVNAESFAIKLNNDSMEPLIQKGTTIVMNSFKNSNKIIADGAFYAVLAKDGPMTVRRIYKIKNRLHFKAENKDYMEEVLPASPRTMDRIIGKIEYIYEQS